MKRFLKYLRITTVIILIIWLLLSIWAEAEGPAVEKQSGNATTPRKALIVYDADPFYNLDEQVCTAFAEALAQNGFYCNVATVAAAKNNSATYQLYVLCANTYNWAPDRAVQGFIKSKKMPEGASVVAITLGSGSTESSKRKLERLITNHNYKLLDSKTFWLLRPNDETRMDEKNTKVALDLVKQWAKQIAQQIKE
jgi:hypothetical protein